MLREDVKSILDPAYPVLGFGGPKRTEELYTGWVQELVTPEYADELVVLVVTLELPVRIVIIPHTPASALKPWRAPVHGAVALVREGNRTVYLGNNDVHFVYLSPRGG